MLRQYFIKIVVFCVFLLIALLCVLFFMALENPVVFLTFIVFMILLAASSGFFLNKSGDKKQGIKVIYGRIYAEEPIYTYLTDKKAIYELYKEIATYVKRKQKVFTIAFEEERSGNNVYIRDSIGKISIYMAQIKLKIDEIDVNIANIHDLNWHWKAHADVNIDSVKAQQLLDREEIVAVGKITEDKGVRTLEKVHGQPYYIMRKRQFMRMQRAQSWMMSLWLSLFLGIILSIALYRVSNDVLLNINNFIEFFLGGYWNELLLNSLKDPIVFTLKFLKYNIALLFITWILLFKVPLICRISTPIVLASLAWLAIMSCMVLAFYAFSLNMMIMWMVLIILYVLMAIYFIVHMNYVRIYDEQHKEYLE